MSLIETCKQFLNNCKETDLEGIIAENNEDVSKVLQKANTIVLCGNMPWVECLQTALKQLQKNNTWKILLIDIMEISLSNEKDSFTSILEKEKKLDHSILFVICSRMYLEEYMQYSKKQMGTCLVYSKLLLYLMDKTEEVSLIQNPNGYCGNMAKIFISDILKNAPKYLQLLKELQDEKSKELLSRIILFRIHFEPELAEGVKSNLTNYFDEEIFSFGENEIVVDAGGYIGDTLTDFLKIVKEEHVDYQEYHLFEPTNAIEEAKKVTTDRRVHFHPYGLYSETKKLAFNLKLVNGKETGISCVDPIGKDVIPVIKLDEYLNRPITFLKMDIEGSEIEALSGCRQLIQNYQPKLAICIYHKYEDILKVYACIQSMGNYKFYMRAERNNLLVDYVLYAVPNR